MAGLCLSALSSLALFTLGLSLHFGFIHTNSQDHQQTHAQEQKQSASTLLTAIPAKDHAHHQEQASSPEAEPNTRLPATLETHQKRSKNNHDSTAQIAIIIDDLGYQWRNGLQSIELEGDYTLAILPFSPYATRLAQRAEAYGKEVMLHAPMEPLEHQAWDGGLNNQMNQEDVKKTLELMLEKIPQAKGVNNHMGSSLTQNSAAMSWVMEALAGKGLYFIDSLTTAHSQAFSAAQKQAIPSQKRDIFLDNERSTEAIAIQFKKLLHKANKYGTAIAICHPYPETLAFLNDIDAKLKSSNVRLVSISHLLSTSQKLTHAPPKTQQIVKTQAYQRPPDYDPLPHKN